MSEELHTLVGLYVVDALDDDERIRFEEHLAGCAACQQEVAEFHATTGRLSQLMAEPPPPALRATIMERIAGTPQEAPTPPRDELAARRRGSWREVIVPGLAVAAAVIALLLGIGWISSHRALDRQQAISEVLTASDATSVDLGGDKGSMRIVYSPTLDRSVVVADGLADLPSDKTYALWFIGPNGPEEAGLFRTSDGRATTVLPRTPQGYQTLGVTAEPAGGSDTPTAPILLQGQLPAA
jgi:anti-sigma-K factor RskA